MQYRHISAARLAGTPPAAFARHRPQFTRTSTRIRAALEGVRWQMPAVEDLAVVTIAEVAECGCPDWCHLDHENA